MIPQVCVQLSSFCNFTLSFCKNFSFGRVSPLERDRSFHSNALFLKFSCLFLQDAPKPSGSFPSFN